MKTPIPVKRSTPLFFFLFALTSLFPSCKKDNIVVPPPVPEVTAAPSASFEYSISGTKAPVIVTFASTSMNAASVEWNFGDGDISNAPVVKREFDEGGTHEIKLTATGPGGTNTKIQQVQIADEAKGLTIKSFTVSATKTTGLDEEPAETGEPDIYFKVVDKSAGPNTLFLSNEVKNVSVFPLVWSANIDLAFGDNANKKFTIQLWDDDIVNSDDLIAELDFIPSAYMTLKNYYPAEVTLSNDETIVKLLIEWH